MKLLPGGRFLLAWNQNTLHVYDIRCVSKLDSQKNQDPVFALSAQMLTGVNDDRQHWECKILHTFVQDDLVLFFTFLEYGTDDSRPSALIAYQITSIGSKPSGNVLQRLLSIQPIKKDTSCCLCLSTSRLAFKCRGDVIRVWDYARNLVASFRTQYWTTDIVSLAIITCRLLTNNS